MTFGGFMRFTTPRRLGIVAGIVLSVVLGNAAAASAGPEDPVMRPLSALCVEPGTSDFGSQLVTATCTDSDPQRWAFTGTGGTSFRMRSLKTHGCMDAHGAYVAGTPIDTWPCANI